MSFTAGFPEPSLMAELTANMLLEIKAVHFPRGRALQAHIPASPAPSISTAES